MMNVRMERVAGPLSASAFQHMRGIVAVYQQSVQNADSDKSEKWLVLTFATRLSPLVVKFSMVLQRLTMQQTDYAREQSLLASDVSSDPRNWTRILACYRNPNHQRSVFELGITVGPLVLLWILMYAGLALEYRLCLVLAVPAAGFLVRLFMIQHDCGHGAFFRYRGANDWVGRAIGVVTLTPYDFWRRTHSIHHATSGNLDRRGIGDIDTLTVREYLALSWLGQIGYRLYRHPLVMFGLGPAYMFIIRHRLPIGLMREGWKPWVSTMMTNGAIALLVIALMLLVGIGPFLLVYLPTILLGGSIGVWLFYVQHQFADTVWADDRTWNLQEAALHGSSHYDLPSVLRCFTADIGVHHVHHLCSRIPFYRVRQVLRDHPELGDIGRITLLQSFKCVRLVLWDENRQRLVSFREMRKARCVKSSGKISSKTLSPTATR